MAECSTPAQPPATPPEHDTLCWGREAHVTLGHTVAIVNSAAKHGVTARVLPAVKRLLDGVADVEFVETDSPRHALEIARDAAGFDTVIAVGGDGTVHEVLNGIMARPETDRPALTIIPTGSGNDYARTLGISFDLPEAVRQIASGERKRVDVGLCNGIWFNNSVAVGLDARVTAKAVEMKVTTGWSGLPLYLRSLFFVLFNQYHSHELRVTFDGGEPADLDLLIVAMTHGPTYGGGFFITPDSVPDDGVLDVCVIRSIPLAEALWRLPFVILGKHTRMRPVTMSRHTSVLIESAEPVAGQIDGEVLLDTRYEVTTYPGGLEVVVPRKS
ncbi:MAG: diacylglycerol kinase [Coriobacteriaceae bacterium]|nr:diacylglycerol kinase [Coriobacteriaceae bacterium]